MENNSIKRNEIEWEDFRNQVYEKAGAAQSVDETYGAIQLALTLLGDNHSFFVKPDGNSIWGTSNFRCIGEGFNKPTLPDNIGYIAVRISSGSDNQKMIAFAEDIQKSIKAEDNVNVLGWIVDLRGSGGGNMWPALAGIGPILGEGTAGYFIDPNDQQTSWGYSNGASINNQTPVVQLSNPYELINPNPKVAVLLDKGIASSGEAIAISFISRDNTKSFGSPTCGLSTANSGFNLSNNALLYLKNMTWTLILSILAFYGILIAVNIPAPFLRLNFDNGETPKLWYASPGFVIPIVWFILFTLPGIGRYNLIESEMNNYQKQ